MNPMTTPQAWDLVSDAYAEHIRPMLGRFAECALASAQLAEGSHVVDVATGPGTLALQAARAGHRVEAVDFSPKMIEALARYATPAEASRVRAQVGDGTALPFEEGVFDGGFSMFGIMLFADRAKGLSELRRVIRPGGVGVVSSWRPMQEVPLFVAIFSALSELMPSKEPPPTPGMTTAADAMRELQEAGFERVKAIGFTNAFEEPSFDALWRWFPSACAPLALLRARMGEGFAAVEQTLRARALEVLGEGPQRVEMPGIITVGYRPA